MLLKTPKAAEDEGVLSVFQYNEGFCGGKWPLLLCVCRGQRQSLQLEQGDNLRVGNKTTTILRQEHLESAQLFCFGAFLERLFQGNIGEGISRQC